MNKPENPGSWFTEKVLPPVFAALAIGAITSGFATYQAVQTLTSKVEQTDRELGQLRSRVDVVASQNVTRSELQAILERVDLKLELMMAKAGVSTPRQPER